MNADQLPDFFSRGGAGIGGCLTCRYITSYQNGYQAGSNLNLSYQDNAGSLYHGICCFHRTNKTTGFHHAQCFLCHIFLLNLILLFASLHHRGFA
jgi:hypothetical protein